MFTACPEGALESLPGAQPKGAALLELAGYSNPAIALEFPSYSVLFGRVLASFLRRPAVTRLLRCFFLFALIVSCFSTFASADLKIKTRTTVMGHTTESTVYIKGGRERSEMSYGGHGGSVSIMQCDQKRMITISGNQCMVMAMGGGETACPAMPNMGAMARGVTGEEPTAPRKGGVLTITRTSTDTGERQDMFGYKARHIKTSMTMESSPDACNQSHMKMEMDGWYADLAGFSCADESYRGLACSGPGAKRGCSDRIVMKGSGSAAMGYPMKQTMTMTSEHGTFTTTTEVVELENASLEASLFDMPPGCKVMDMSAMTGGAPATHTEAPDSSRSCECSTCRARGASRACDGAQSCGRGARRRGQDQGHERPVAADRQPSPQPAERIRPPSTGSRAAGCRRAAGRRGSRGSRQTV